MQTGPSSGGSTGRRAPTPVTDSTYTEDQKGRLAPVQDKPLPQTSISTPPSPTIPRAAQGCRSLLHSQKIGTSGTRAPCPAPAPAQRRPATWPCACTRYHEPPRPPRPHISSLQGHQPPPAEADAQMPQNGSSPAPRKAPDSHSPRDHPGHLQGPEGDCSSPPPTK